MDIEKKVTNLIFTELTEIFKEKIHEYIKHDDLERAKAILNEAFQYRNHDLLGGYLHDDCRYNSKYIAMCLLKFGADANYRNSYGLTPLMIASKTSDSIDIISMLLEHGADINAENDVGHTALTMASFSNNVDTVRILIHKGADKYFKTTKGYTPLERAKIGNSIKLEELKELLS